MRQPPILRYPDDVIDAQLSGDLRSPINTTIIDHQGLDCIEPIQFAGYPCEGYRKGVSFIEAWNLNDEFHW